MREIDDDLDVAGRCSSASLKRASGTRRVIRRAEPIPVGARQRVGRHLVVRRLALTVPKIDVVVEHHACG